MIADPITALVADWQRESALRMDTAGIPRLVREVCPQCSGSGRCASSTWDHPQTHVGRCAECAGRGSIAHEVTL